MVEQEKVTINVSPVDVAKIDYLVDNAFYSNRSDFIRTAIRSQLDKHDSVVSEEALTKKAWVIGAISYTQSGLAKLADKNQRVSIFVIGALHFSSDVSLGLVRKTIDSAKIYGSVTGPKEVVQYVKGLE